MTGVDDFICPECGSREVSVMAMIQPVPNETDPWSSVLQTMRCASCRREIPTHLAERWEGISVKEARKEWREVYRGRRRGSRSG